MAEAIRQGDIPGVQLRCRRRFSTVTTTQLWAWVTDVEKLCHWMADQVEASRETDALVLKCRSPEGDVVERITLRQENPPSSREFDFGRQAPEWPVSTQLMIEITEVGEETEISVLHHGFQHLPLSHCLTTWEAYRVRWAGALERLAEALGEARN